MGLSNSRGFIMSALREDIGRGDITTKILISENKKMKAVLLLKENAVIAGLDIAGDIFESMDAAVRFKAYCRDGAFENSGKIIAGIEGRARKILSAERTALNLLSHLSGIATMTAAFVKRVRPYPVKIMDTRKTIPGLRALQKYAVKMGGGYNHRMGLWDWVLIKDNHINVLCAIRSAQCLKELVEIVKGKRPKNMKVEIEVKNLQEFKEALKARPDIIMLDNMKIDDIKKAVTIKRNMPHTLNTAQIEASGGVNLDNVRQIAKTGVDMISIGALTHSAKAIDISLEI
jgi:nicotinate-nucleotide pyrophosphorylase (carboxylating)